MGGLASAATPAGRRQPTWGQSQDHSTSASGSKEVGAEAAPAEGEHDHSYADDGERGAEAASPEQLPEEPEREQEQGQPQGGHTYMADDGELNDEEHEAALVAEVALVAEALPTDKASVAEQVLLELEDNESDNNNNTNSTPVDPNVPRPPLELTNEELMVAVASGVSLPLFALLLLAAGLFGPKGEERSLPMEDYDEFTY